VSASANFGVAAIRVMPSLSVMSLNLDAVRALDVPAYVIFYNLRNGRTILEGLRVPPSSPTEVYALLRGRLIGAKTYKVSMVNRTGLVRTPRWVRKLAQDAPSRVYFGKTVRGCESSLYFDFSDPAETGTVSLKDVVLASRSATDFFGVMIRKFTSKKRARKVEDSDSFVSSVGRDLRRADYAR
jgi:hypothetical protein